MMKLDLVKRRKILQKHAQPIKGLLEAEVGNSATTQQTWKLKTCSWILSQNALIHFNTWLD